MEIKLNAQSSIKIKTNKIIYFDPFMIKEETHDADYIFITHDHYDHFDMDSINKIINDNTIIVMPNSMVLKNIGYFNSDNIRGVDPNEEYNIENLRFVTVPSYNTNKNFHKKENNWVGYLLNIEEQGVYVAGDTDLTEETKKVKCDIAFVPIGGTYTMDYEEAALLINTIKPRLVIPTHYKTVVGKEEDAKNFKNLLIEDVECQIIME